MHRGCGPALIGTAGFLPDGRRGRIGHGLPAGDAGGNRGGPPEDEVAALSCFFAILGAEGDADALLGVVRMVHRGMEPPGAVVVPDVVVGVEVEVCFHAPIRTHGVGHPLSQAKKKPAPRCAPQADGPGDIPCLIGERLR